MEADRTRHRAAVGTSLCLFAAVVVLTGAIARDDDGAKTFFLSNAPLTFAAERAEAAASFVHDLAIRPRPRKVAAHARRLKLMARTVPRAKAVTRVARRNVPATREPITIYTDSTLQPGDAVMTANGIRVFRGSDTLPHRDSDFVGLTHARGLSRSVSRTLAFLDAVPGG